MNKDAFKYRVERLFPYKFNDALCSDDVDEILTHAIEIALSKFEKVKTIEIAGSQIIPDALSILKCVPSQTVNTYNVFDFMRDPRIRPTKLKWYFDPNDRQIIFEVNTSAHVEYIQDPAGLTIEDLTPQYIQWTIKYALALLKEKEGLMGKGATLDALPFTLNYEDMYSQGFEQTQLLDEELEEMYYGLFTGKA